MVEVGLVCIGGRVPQFGKLRFQVPVHEHSHRDRVSLKTVRVHIKLAVLDRPPGTGFGFIYACRRATA